MGAPPRLGILGAAALTLSAAGAVMMGYSGATGAAVAPRPQVEGTARTATADAETREHRCGATTSRSAESRNDREGTAGCRSGDGRVHGVGAQHDGRDHESHDSGDHDSRCAGDEAAGDPDCPETGAADSGRAHHAAGVAAGAPPASGQAPTATADPGGPAGAAGRPAPPDTETATTTTTSSSPATATRSAGAGVSAASLPRTAAPVVPVTGADGTFGAGLLLCLAGLSALLLARRR